MKIELLISGEKKEFVCGFIPGRIFRKTIEMQKKLQGEINETVLDAMVEYVVDLFGKQFTVDQFYDGIDARKMLPTIVKCVNEVIEGGAESLGVDGDSPNDQTGITTP